MKKQLLLLFSLALPLSLLAQPKVIYDEKYAGSWYSAVSNNGRFVVGANPAFTEAYLVDTKTGETKVISDSPYNDVKDVSDNGTIIVGKFYDPDVECIVPGVYKEGKWMAVERPQALNGGGWDGSINVISGDGKLMGGTIPFYDAQTGTVSITKYEPAIWGEDGKMIRKLPIYDAKQGAGLTHMSDDGNIACGWYNGSMYGKNIIWKNEEKIDTLIFNGSGMVVSANGKFVGGSCGKGMASPASKPYLWSEEDGLIIVDCPEETKMGYVTGITNDGKIAVGFVELSNQMTEDRHPFIIVDGVYHDFDTWMKETYNIEAPYDSFWSIGSISADGNVMCGIGYYDEAREPWIIVLDESKLPEITSIATAKADLDVNVTYDATSHLLHIQGEYTSASLYNNTGSCIFTDKHAKDYMDTSNLSNGIYFIKIMKGKNVRTFKIAITN